MSGINEIVVAKLIDINASVATAESCTGGLIAATLVDVSGASAVFNEGYITYSNEAKIKNLGVLSETLDEFGAVSQQTAAQMAEGVRRTANADFGISSTGIAGPTGGTAEKPVGLVYIACSFLEQTIVKKLNLDGSREEIRRQAVDEALHLLNECIVKYKE